MYYFTDMCVLCLVRNKNNASVLSKDDDGVIIEVKLKYVLSEVVNFKPEISKTICIDCLKDMNHLYKFKQKCLRNLKSLIEQVEKITAENKECNHSASSVSKTKHKLKPGNHKSNNSEVKDTGLENKNKQIEQNTGTNIVVLRIEQEDKQDDIAMQNTSLLFDEVATYNSEEENIVKLESEEDDTYFQINLNLSNNVGEFVNIFDEIDIKDEPLFLKNTNIDILQDEAINNADAKPLETENMPATQSLEDRVDHLKDQENTLPVTQVTRPSENENILLVTQSLEDRIQQHDIPENSTEIQISRIPVSRSTKKYFCIFCKDLVTRLVRHLEHAHRNEPDVIQFSKLPRGSKKRMQLIEVIRKKGAFQFNTNKEFNSGELMLIRRPHAKRNKSANDFAVCPYCTGFYSKRAIGRHFRKCLPPEYWGSKRIRVYGRRVLGNVHEKACAILKNEIFPIMRDDIVTNTIRYDLLIILFGNALCIKYRSTDHYFTIRSRIRYLGRLLIEIKTINEDIKDLASALTPEYYDVVVCAAKKMARFSEHGGPLPSPTSVNILSTVIKKCCKILIAEYLKDQNSTMKRLTEDFLNKFAQVFPGLVNSATHLEIKSKPEVLPNDNDLKLLDEYLTENRTKAFNSLETKFSVESWKNLSQFTFISLHIFNRRPAEELEKIKISDFAIYQSVDQDKLRNLNSEHSNAKVCFFIRGKFGRVPILLHEDLLKCVKIILQYRQTAGIVDENPFVFALPKDKDRYLRVKYLLQKFLYDCGASNSGTLPQNFATQNVLSNPSNLSENNEVNREMSNLSGKVQSTSCDESTFCTSKTDSVSQTFLQATNLGTEEVQEVSDSNSQLLGSSKRSDANLRTEDFQNLSDSDAQVTGLSKRFVSPFETAQQKKCASKITEVSTTEDDENLCDSEPLLPRNSKRSALPCESVQRKKMATEKDDENLPDPDYELPRTSKRSVSPYGRIIHRAWDTPEKQKAKTLFKEHIIKEILPSLAECMDAIKNNKEFQNRSAPSIKTWVSNQINFNRRLKSGKTVRTWQSPERQMAKDLFADYIKEKKLPSETECSKQIKIHAELQRRTAAQLKAFVNNEIRRNERKECFRRDLFH